MSLITPSFGLLFWMLFIFGIVFFILYRYGFPVIVNMVRERNASISEALKGAEEARQELASLSKEQSELLLQAKREQARILDDAAKLKASIIEQAKHQAQEEAAKVLAQARSEIAAEKESALRDIRNEVAVLSLNITEKILRTDFNSEQTQKQYMDRIMAELSKGTGNVAKN